MIRKPALSRIARRRHQLDRIGDQRGIDIDLPRACLHRQQRLGGGDGADPVAHRR